MKLMENTTEHLSNLDKYLDEKPDDRNHRGIVNQLKNLQNIADGFGYGDLFDLSKEELICTIESSGVILGEAIYRLIALVRHYAIWAYEQGLVHGKNRNITDVKQLPAMSVALKDIHVSQSYKYHIFRNIDELMKFIDSFWLPGEGQYAAVVAALCWCGIPYKDCVQLKDEDVILLDDPHIMYRNKRLDVPLELVRILRDHRETDVRERRFRGRVRFYAVPTDKFIKMFTSTNQVASGQVNRVSISRDLHRAVSLYNEATGLHMEINGPDIYLSGRLNEAKKIYDEFGNVTEEELRDIFVDGTELSSRKLSRIRYNIREYIAFLEA